MSQGIYDLSAFIQAYEVHNYSVYRRAKTVNEVTMLYVEYLNNMLEHQYGDIKHNTTSIQVVFVRKNTKLLLFSNNLSKEILY